jgi:6-phosphofructokinase 1
MEGLNLRGGASPGAIAVFTSGGDAPGMNALVRAVARLGAFYGRDVFAIYEGFQGMVEGGSQIRRLSWEDTRMIIHRGGTVIGSARCAEFRERPGRLRACRNLVKNNITNVVCCGGDGSLTGCDIFKKEWSGLLSELVATGEISAGEAERCAYLNLVGSVGSIDNDMVYDGTLTIGTDTAMHRIVDAIDAVQSTASSHQRTFVLEIMGRHCGYLAWAAGVATAADYVFIPESPPKDEDWESSLCATLDRRRKNGARLCTVLVAEGAVDRKGKAIKTDYVRQVIESRLHHDTRATILGHVQRGGNASGYDRVIATLTGAMCIEKLRRAQRGEVSTIVGLKGFVPKFNPLVETVAATQLVGKYMDALDFDNAILARKKDFKRNFEFHKAVNREAAKMEAAGPSLVIVCSGAPAAGMNAAVRAGCHYAMNFGLRVLVASGGLEGLAAGNVRPLAWMECNGWVADAGCHIMCDRGLQALDVERVNAVLKEHGIGGVLLVGGFDALKALYDARDKLAAPAAFLPATISNNVPGTDFSLGSDTAVNAIVAAVDTCKKSADSSTSRVFILETQGRNSGYLAQVSAIAGGADIVYTREEGVSLAQMQRDIARVKDMITRHNKRHFVIVRNEFCSDSYDLRFMETLFAEEGKGWFSVRTVKLGHLCQGDSPSPLDRVRALLFAANGMRFLIDNLGTTNKVVVGINASRTGVRPLDEVGKEADWKARLPKQANWAWTLCLQHKLANYDSSLHDDDYAALCSKLCMPEMGDDAGGEATPKL